MRYSLSLQGFQQTGDLSESLFYVLFFKVLTICSSLPVTLTQDLKRMAVHSELLLSVNCALP